MELEEASQVMNPVAIQPPDPGRREIFSALALTVVATAFFVALVAITGGTPFVLAVLPVLAVTLFVVMQNEYARIFIVASLFVNLSAFGFSAAVWASLAFVASSMVRHPDRGWSEFRHPLSRSIVLYGLCVVPSLINAFRPAMSLLLLMNPIAFAVVLSVVYADTKQLSDTRDLLVTFLVLAVANSFDVVRLALLGEGRPFGFAGIWFVDYSALGVCLSVAAAVVSDGRARKYLLLAAGIIGLGLLLAQTRNTWISALLTLAVFLGYLVRYPEMIRTSRRRLLGGIAGALAAGVVVFLLAAATNARVASRLADVTATEKYSISAGGMVGNSLVSRMLIWDTAVQAFLAHPLIGMGVYAFPYASHLYYRIPRVLFNLYVVGSHPHQTHLAVLAETGVLGAIGFVTFVLTALRRSYQTIGLARSARARKFALVAFVGIVYCCVSMFFTDAWLWGQQIILLALIMGAAFGIRKVIEAEPSSSPGPLRGRNPELP
jgi:O-antigen ligase